MRWGFMQRFLSLNSAIGNYQLISSSGEIANFSILLDGVLEPTPGEAGDCKLQGVVSATTLPNMLKMQVSTKFCTAMGPDFGGVLVLDSDQKPAAYRMLSTDSENVRDYWIYRH